MSSWRFSSVTVTIPDWAFALLVLGDLLAILATIEEMAANLTNGPDKHEQGRQPPSDDDEGPPPESGHGWRV